MKRLLGLVLLLSACATERAPMSLEEVEYRIKVEELRARESERYRRAGDHFKRAQDGIYNLMQNNPNKQRCVQWQNGMITCQ